MKSSLSLAALLVCGGLLAAQTINTPLFNQLTINGVGAGGTSCIVAAVGTGAGLTFNYSALPNSPIILATDAACAAGTLVLGANNIVDITLTGALSFLLDGVGGGNGWISQFLRTNAAGTLSLTIPNAPATPGLLPLQGVVFGAGYAGGFNLTSAFSLIVPTDPNLAPGTPVCNPGSVTVPGTGDDTSTVINLVPSAGPTWFNYYGLALTQIFVGSNGYLTQSAYTTFGESAAGLTGTAGGAKIAAHFDDLNIISGGTLTSFVNDTVAGAEIAEFCWTAVPEFGSTTVFNTFKITLTPTSIVMDYGAMGSTDGLVGLSSGTLATVATSYNMSFGALNNTLSPLGPTKAPFELFTGLGSAIHDLDNLQITFGLNLTGVPISQN